MGPDRSGSSYELRLPPVARKSQAPAVQRCRNRLQSVSSGGIRRAVRMLDSTETP
jgi:hypothetical protein